METERPPAPAPSAMATAPPAPSPSPAGSAAAAPLAFAGSSDQDVALAKSFWNSVTLQPPLESRLGARCGSLCDGASSQRRSSTEREEDKHSETEKDVWKEHCLEKAKKREDIIALLKKQREERISKESLSYPHKPKSRAPQRDQEDESSKREKEELSEDEGSVKALP
ncbi:cilia- and flagella-associated protein HOATZ isoform X2 [Crotalus tigris]|uniref:cilia- and flagella-associated protein HOATZ isoform X2 n=1 Tax=Crotalus tigris TaxID=88082 RepID=UPI00192F37AD|nr:cilia- and flagella-associated protein HOATZ isoform X2 [Crotalus tigris]